MTKMRLGYFRMEPVVNPDAATIIFVPAFAKFLSAVETAMWGQQNGYGQINYVPAKVITIEDTHAAA